MNDIRTQLERRQRELHAPPGSFERLLRRRDRRRRNQRILAGSVGIAVFVAATWFVTSGGRFDRTQTPAVQGGAETGPAQTGPADTGPTVTGPPETDTYDPWLVTDEDVAFGKSFLDAWVDGDGEAAAAMFTPGGTFDGFQPAMLPALHDWFRAGGWTFENTGCWPRSESGNRRGIVECSFTYDNELTRTLDIEPVDGGRLALIIHDGRIEAAATQVGETRISFGTGGSYLADNMFRSPNPARSDPFGAVWDTFIGWISTNHPEDFERMYDSGRGYPILDATSTGLWERYTDELVGSPQALGEAMAEWRASQGFDFQARRICEVATERFDATATAGELRRADSAFFSTLADAEEGTLAELRALPLATDVDRATMDTFVPLAERMIEVHRRMAEAAAAGDHERLNELSGEEFDLKRDLTLTIWGCLVAGGRGPM